MRLGRSTGATDTGRKRRRNEDSFVREPPLFAVADGMGGAQAGEIASSLAASALRDQGGAATSGAERVVALIHEANRRVFERAEADPAVAGMGTTMTVALVEDGVVHIGHVGDSRAYLLRGSSLEQLTDDHSLVAELMRGGKISEHEAATHPQRSVITRALGTDPDVDVDAFTVEARDGDVFLLCSDGLTTMLGDDSIAETLETSRGDLDAAARALIKEANRRGGEDNITVVFFEVVEGAGSDDGDTTELPALSEPAPDPDDEDTLDELDAVPVVDTMVVAPEDAERFAAATAPQPAAKRRSRWSALLGLLALLALVATAALWLLLR